jgi:hypothetical protein
LMADCGWRQSQLVRGRFKTHVARSRLEGAQRFAIIAELVSSTA